MLRPGLAYLVILVMMVPAYLGLRKPQVSEIGPPQVLVIPRGLRSAPDVYLDHDLGSDGLIRFTYGEAVVGKSYTVLIQSEDGKVLYQDNNFAEFDERGEAELCLPRARMRPGFYLLVVIDPEVGPPGNRTEYSFTIK